LAQGDFVFFLPGGPPFPGPGIAPPPPVPLLGHLQLNVSVAGAQVYLNNRPIGSASPGKPLNLSNLPVGRVEVRVTDPDYKPQTQWVTIRHGLWAQPVFCLEPIASIAPPAEVTHPSAAKPKQGDQWRDPVTDMEFVWVPGGCFQMRSNEGSPMNDRCTRCAWTAFGWVKSR
jgi:hypothetical protein